MFDFMLDVRLALLTNIQNLYGYVRYDLFKANPIDDFRRNRVMLPRDIKVHIEKESDGFFAVMDNYPGLRTSASTEAELVSNVNDAIFTYFSVPQPIAKRLPDIYQPADRELDGDASFELSTNVVPA